MRLLQRGISPRGSDEIWQTGMSAPPRYPIDCWPPLVRNTAYWCHALPISDGHINYPRTNQSVNASYTTSSRKLIDVTHTNLATDCAASHDHALAAPVPSRQCDECSGQGKR